MTTQQPEDDGIPPEMLLERLEDDWGVWKIVPSKLNRKDIEDVFSAHGVSAPEECIQYFLADCHLIDQVQAYGENGASIIPIPSDNALGPLDEFLDSWAPLIALGYVPLGQYGDSYGPICLKQSNHKVIWVDHERLHSLTSLDADAVAALEQPLHESVSKYYAEVLGMNQST